LQLLAEDEGQVTGSAYAGHVGVPAYFPASAFSSLLQLRGDTGAREMLRGARSIAAEELALDIDTETDLERARARL
jgi:CTP:molybdopterin cytidylyltransferase MocA